MTQILTERCRATLVTAEDAAEVTAYYTRNAAHLARWEPERPEGYHDPAQWQVRVRDFAKENREGRAQRYVVRRKDAPQIVAVINFTNIVRGPFQACMLGYSADAAAEGKGLMREVLGALIPVIFGDLGLHRIMANYMPENERSARLLERLGFEREGYARDYLQIAGRWRDHVLTALTAPQ